MVFLVGKMLTHQTGEKIKDAGDIFFFAPADDCFQEVGLTEFLQEHDQRALIIFRIQPETYIRSIHFYWPFH